MLDEKLKSIQTNRAVLETGEDSPTCDQAFPRSVDVTKFCDESATGYSVPAQLITEGQLARTQADDLLPGSEDAARKPVSPHI